MKKLGYFFIGLGIIDLLSIDLFGVDFYALFGINLTGYAYEFSPFAAGLLGIIIIYMDKDKDLNHKIETMLASEEEIILTRKVSIKKGGIFSGMEHGIFFITNKRIGYMGNMSQSLTGSSTDESEGNYDFSCDIKKISKIEGGLASFKIEYDNKNLKFTPGITRVKDIVNIIKGLKEK
jgi:hypothetical protein